MRLWHESLILYLPYQQLLGQHRECCALRGNGWGKKHSIVDYVFNYSPARLYHYHWGIMMEMKDRGYEVNKKWLDCCYRGINCEPWNDNIRIETAKDAVRLESGCLIYEEHDKNYLKECLNNLKKKGIKISL